jgi:hypothetical protein
MVGLRRAAYLGRMPPRLKRTLVAASLALAASAAAHAGTWLPEAGPASIDGAAGGGLTPWAMPLKEDDPLAPGARALARSTRTFDYQLALRGGAVQLTPRLELSLARQLFDTRGSLAALGLADERLRQDIAGLKLRLAGPDRVEETTSAGWLAVGLLRKRIAAGTLQPVLEDRLGARCQGFEFYAAATRYWADERLVLNATLRATRANQNGLLGFGGRQAGGTKFAPEFSLAWQATPHLTLGMEARAKPDNLNHSVLGNGALREDGWFDAWVGWSPRRDMTLNLSWLDLGRIAPGLQPRRQSGSLLTLQVSYR